jgi:dihydroxy-acid dehydratase
VLEDLKPREILTPAAFRNAAAAVLAVCGSINCIKHLQATAIEAGLDLDVFGLFNELGPQIPMLSAVAPNGHDTIDAFEAAGGARALLKQLEPHLDRGALTVTGKSMGENLEHAVVHDDQVIRPLDRPFSDRPSIVVLQGSLAPESAIIKPGWRDAGFQPRFTGTAVVYDGVPEAIAGVKKGEVRPGHVLVARGMGPKGGPAMAGSASRIVFALYAAGLEDTVAFVSDGQLSGLCNKGVTVAEISPEAAIGGPLSLVEHGDRVVVDVVERRLDLEVPDAELAVRRVKRGEPRLPKSSGYLSIYQRTVQPMSTGAVLVEKENR